MTNQKNIENVAGWMATILQKQLGSMTGARRESAEKALVAASKLGIEATDDVEQFDSDFINVEAAEKLFNISEEAIRWVTFNEPGIIRPKDFRVSQYVLKEDILKHQDFLKQVDEYLKVTRTVTDRAYFAQEEITSSIDFITQNLRSHIEEKTLSGELVKIKDRLQISIEESSASIKEISELERKLSDQ